jgi:large subunit ribosomal protein L21
MYAVIKTGGKQYRVAKDDVIVVESLAGEPGAMVEFGDVLMLGGGDTTAEVNRDALSKAAVFAEVVEQTRGEKIIIFKKKRRQNYRRKKGHRQNLTVLKILDVSPTGTKPKVAAPAKKAPVEAEKKEAAAETDAPAARDTAPKAAAKKAPAKKTPAKKAPAKKAAAKKAAPKKAPAKKAAAKSKPKSKE